MMQQIESNDLGFTAAWSPATKLKCGTLFLNEHLPDDVFFNKLSGITCISEEMIDRSMDLLRENHSIPCIYSVGYPELDALLKRKGFSHYDTQHVLKKSPLGQSGQGATKITRGSAKLWADVFCRAYDCPSWKGPVVEIIEYSLDRVDYFLDNSQSSCMALYEKGRILGLYCLGTLPGKRNCGLAASMINFASREAYVRNMDCLVLETYQRDNLVGFYSKLGFETVYHKDVYSI